MFTQGIRTPRLTLLVAVLLAGVLLLSACPANETNPYVVEFDAMQLEPQDVEAGVPAPDVVSSTDVVGADGAAMSATRLMGEDVENLLGEDLGEIEDLMLDWSTGTVLFATIERGGFLGIDDEDLPVPLSALAWSPADENLILNISEEVLKTFPEIEDRWPILFEPGWEMKLASFWQGAGLDTSILGNANVETVVWASELIESDAGAYETPDLGGVEDLVVDLEQSQVTYVVVSLSDVSIDGEAWRLVPYAAFDPVVFGDVARLELAADFEPAFLAGAPGVAEADLYDMDLFDPVWDVLYQEYWVEAGVIEPGFVLAPEAGAPEAEPAVPEEPVILEEPEEPEEPVTQPVAADGEMNTVWVELIAYNIHMPDSIPAGPTRFEVMNVGDTLHNFALEGQGSEWVFAEDLLPGETVAMEVDLEPGEYTVYCPVANHRDLGMETTLMVTGAVP